MRLIPWFAALLVLLGVSVGLFAQPQDTFVITTYPPPMGLARFSADGTVLGTLATFPSDFMPNGMVVAEDNQSYRAFGWMDSLPGDPPVIFDVSPQGIVTTLHLGAPLIQLEQMVRTCDDDWLLFNRHWYGHLECYRYQGKSLGLLSTFGPIFTHSVTRNPEFGVLHVRGVIGMTSLVSMGYYRMDPWNGTLNTTYSYPPRPGLATLQGPRHPIYDVRSGSYFDAQYFFGPRTCNLVQVATELGVTTISSTLVRYPVDLMRPGGRARGFDFYFLASHSVPPGGPPEIIRVKRDGTMVGKSLLNYTGRWQLGLGVLREGSRHLDWRMNSRPNGRSLHLSFPGETGLGYVVGLSLSGIRPGIALGDGREIPLVPDSLTWRSLKGGVPGVLEHTVGKLDTYGRAKVKVDTNAFGSLLKGIRIWAVALVLDPAAPAGVAHIAGPTLLSIRQ